jgi:ribosomal protein S18 acetylase RimI-like enzyme
MPLATRNRDDVAPALEPMPQLVVRRETDATRMAAIQGRTETEMRARFDAGHRAYVAELGGETAAWGWVATRSAEIGELKAVFPIPDGERYLWNFVTAKTHRGLGIYPRLVDAIVQAESGEATRFWIAYAPENHASGSGIRKAGFGLVAELSFTPEGEPAVQGMIDDGGAAAAKVFGVAETSGPLAPCWRCVRAGHATSCAAGSCRCDYQVPKSGCDA